MKIDEIRDFVNKLNGYELSILNFLAWKRLDKEIIRQLLTSMNNNEISFLVQRPKAYYKPLLGHKYNSQLLSAKYLMRH